MGEATFDMEFGTPQHVRTVSLIELKASAVEMKGSEGDRFFALLSLRGALESEDELALEGAKGRLKRAFQLRGTESPRNVSTNPETDRHFAEMLAKYVGMAPVESLEYLEGLGPGPGADRDPARLLSYEISEEVGFPNARIALWYVNGSFRPAIYCADKKTALYIHTFFIAPAGGLGFRICPYVNCEKREFFQDRPNQDYCCPAHRDAHRVARWREQKKVLATHMGNR